MVHENLFLLKPGFSLLLSSNFILFPVLFLSFNQTPQIFFWDASFTFRVVTIIVRSVSSPFFSHHKCLMQNPMQKRATWGAATFSLSGHKGAAAQ